MYNKNKILYLVTALAVITLSFITLRDGEHPFTDLLRQKLKAYHAVAPGEKIYLHIDKPLYAPGDELWFKAYVVDASSHEPTRLSEILYVELINPRGSVEKTLTLPVSAGWARGDFHFGSEAPGGIYKIRAYTRWMKNFDAGYQFEKSVQLQKVLYPRLLMKLDFGKEAYGPGDRVDASLDLRTLEDAALADRTFRFTVSISGKEIFTRTGTSNHRGEGIVSFRLPEDLNSSDGLLNIQIDHEGHTESISRAIPIQLNDIDIQFLPEGGSMVFNTPCRVAFKALNSRGKPADVTGWVISASGDTITSFESFHQGMGAFDLTPATDGYYAVITRPAGIEKPFPLPSAQNRGYALRATYNLTRQEINLQIASPAKTPGTLIAQMRGKIVYEQNTNLKKGVNQFRIPTHNMPEGILHITYFDNYNIARCERLVYVRSGQRLYVEIAPEKQEYLPREEVTLYIRTLDKDSIPVPAHLSLAVVNDKVLSFADDKQDHILSAMLLSSDLAGEVYEPAFYFDPDEEKAVEAMDYLMLTQGWSRFTWKQVFEGGFRAEYMPEKATHVSGYVKDIRTGRPVSAEVTLLELAKGQRFATVRTASDGKFVFMNVNPFIPCNILAKADGIPVENLQVVIRKDMQAPLASARLHADGEILIPPEIRINIPEVSQESRETTEQEVEVNMNVSLSPDVVALEETVVVGYGVMKKSDVTGSISVVREEEILAAATLDAALQGRVPGVNIIRHSTGVPGEAVNVQIRGIATISGDEPLYVVDGIPLPDHYDRETSPIGYLDPKDIESIEILKDVSAASIYGSRGANGVILITTRNGDYGRRRGKYITPKKRYKVVPVSPVTFSRIREFYTPKYKTKEKIQERNDFRSTIYWNPDVHTDIRGRATIKFCNSDEITTFRAIAEGTGPKGLVGRAESTWFVRLPFGIETRIPPYLCFDDTARIPVILKNNTDDPVSGRLKLSLPDHLQTLEILPEKTDLLPQSVQILDLWCRVGRVAGKSSIGISFTADGLEDKVTQEIEVQPKGFPVFATLSGAEQDKSFLLDITDPVPGSVKASVTVFPDVTSDLLTGIESILREPYGCFEQTSSCTYPNVLVLDYLKSTQTADPGIERRATSMIEKGYMRLEGFETTTRGFEWFGRSPAHEGLTAYGLLEFTDMQKVWEYVDPEMIRRTVKWLLSRRDGSGNFVLGHRSTYAFGGPNQHVMNAYVVFSLSEAGYNQMEQEYEKALAEAETSKDIYRLGLMSLASYNLGKPGNGDRLLEMMNDQIRTFGYDGLRAEHSITRSYGTSLSVEVAALHLMARLRCKHVSFGDLEETVNYMKNTRSFGGFGSTQATIMALKALTEYAKFMKKTSTSGTVNLYVNDSLTVSEYYPEGARGKINIPVPEELLQAGKNQIRISFTGTQSPLPYSLDVSWTSLTPASSENTPVKLHTALSTGEAKVGETVRLNTTLKNASAEDQPMTIAILGIPAGLSAQPWQLKELQESGVFDYYEVRGNYVIVYYSHLAAHDLKSINLDLKAEVAGNYRAPASTAYLYYTAEDKFWVRGNSISIRN